MKTFFYYFVGTNLFRWNECYFVRPNVISWGVFFSQERILIRVHSSRRPKNVMLTAECWYYTKLFQQTQKPQNDKSLTVTDCPTTKNIIGYCCLPNNDIVLFVHNSRASSTFPPLSVSCLFLSAECQPFSFNQSSSEITRHS